MQDQSNQGLPRGKKLFEILNLQTPCPTLEEFISKTLTLPLQEFFKKSNSHIRSKALEIAYHLTDFSGPLDIRNTSPIPIASEIIELLHMGSIIIDDIQDGSTIRMGIPTLHKKYGLPTALTLGNWLYFYPFVKIRELHLHPEEELELFRSCSRTLLRGHYGQALDIGISIDSIPQEKVPAICLSIAELKTGALMGLAMEMGAIVSNASSVRTSVLTHFGSELGITLQMYDDIGNLGSRIHGSKKNEDLFLRRPSWIWAVAASHLSPELYSHYLNLTRLMEENEQEVGTWIEDNGLLEQAAFLASQRFNQAMDWLEHKIPDHLDKFAALKDLNRTMQAAYL